ncbi:MAG: DUF5060 domain-containing protein [Bacteroidota bacterium]|nr:DUF5060 domain-containing protein [Bacteroidota bacterium]
MGKKFLVLALLLNCWIYQQGIAQSVVEQWGRFEVSFKHQPAKNPFVDDNLSAVFSNGNSKVKVHGFYDGNNTYIVRFMPTKTGTWTYLISSNIPELNGKKGKLVCKPATVSNHGPVMVRNQYHFAYADSTPYYPFGTTVYSYIHQDNDHVAVALNTLAKSPFNKLRFLVFPQWQDYTKVQTPFFPFEKSKESLPKKDTILWDYTRFDPAFFRNMEKHIDELAEKGVEADVILFHPYDEGKWGFDKMSHKTDLFYLKYIVARLSSFRNVWWSLCNEFDHFKYKSDADWDDLIATVAKEDPYHHLCSIHNDKRMFNNTNPALTHACVQGGTYVDDFGRAVIQRDAYKKPVVYDEICYEGDIVYRWGNLSAERMVYRYWQGAIAGCYVGHGETFVGKDSVLHLVWGRELRGRSPERIRFLKNIMAETGTLEQIDRFWGMNNMAKSEHGDILIYLGTEAKTEWPFLLSRDLKLPEGTKYTAEVIDTWNMTRTPVTGIFCTTKSDAKGIYDNKSRTIGLPGKPYMAILLKPTK